MNQPTLFPTDDGPIAGADEFLACSDLCEENQFFQQAAMLRTMAGAGGTVYIVAEATLYYNDEDMVPVGDGQPRSLFFSRAEAEEAALRRNADELRRLPLLEYGINLTDLSNFTSLTEPELNRGVSQALGIDFDLWTGEESATRFPESATDEQMMEVARLFDRLQFFHVIEAEFGG